MSAVIGLVGDCHIHTGVVSKYFILKIARSGFHPCPCFIFALSGLVNTKSEGMMKRLRLRLRYRLNLKGK